ncbi:MAG: ferrous iron transport protein A, partial [Deltaproteobacteria bacterium]|nr:ferrous iron transport protein A [Deltaproteobacteria bacterium]
KNVTNFYFLSAGCTIIYCANPRPSTKRLLSMGLRLKDEIEIVTNPKQGQLVVAVDFKRFVLGRGLAQKIMVQPAERK